MNHPPKQLALLISLIGGGISPYAQARLHEHRSDMAQAMPDVACTELDAIALPRCVAAEDRDLVWQPQRSALDLGGTAGVLVLYGARSDDWAPGESFGDSATDRAPTAAPAASGRIEGPPAQGVSRPAARSHRVRVLAKAAVAQIARFASADSRAIERLERLEPIEHAERASLPIETPRPAASTGSREVERLLANLASVLSGERDAAPPAASSLVASSPATLSHSAQVLATLGEFVAPAAAAASPGSSAVDDGPTRRLRKLAARAAQARDAARAQVAENGVDVLLPIEPLRPLDAPASAASAAQRPRTNPFGDTDVAISETSLDRVRGGYAGEGLNISFGIERAVYINGSLATTTSVNVTDLGQLTAGRGTAVLDTGTIALIQSGAGNSVAGASISASSMGTIVQNTLDGQKIQSVTVINATANSLGVFRTMNLQSSLRGAVIDSLRR